MVPLKRPIEKKEGTISYYSVLYTKRSKKKHKTYLDGFISLKNDRVVVLKDEDGKDVSKTTFHKGLGGLKDGNTLEVGTFELEVQGHINSEDYRSGRVFLPSRAPGSCPKTATPPTTPLGAGVKKKFKLLSHKSSKAQRGCKLQPRYDPTRPNSLVIQKTFVHLSGVKTVPIILDPYIGRHLRPHQKEGIQFLYQAIEGSNRPLDGMRGAILADEMGLGKSLQALALVWTVLRQGPLGRPLAKKVIIVCPASLVNNWVDEVKKWLGFERLNPIAIQGGSNTLDTKSDVADFYYGNYHPLLIISYDMFRRQAPMLCKMDVGLIICDEGHRLKSTSQRNKTIAALSKISCRRRVILTGTPVQNDLDEFFAMCNFVNPGAMGTLKSFRSNFSCPILASRDTNASTATAALGQARAAELLRMASTFVLRRTSETLEKYLPPKFETALFCRLTPCQEELYVNECKKAFDNLSTSGVEAEAALSIITCLRKICNHPFLLESPDDKHQFSGKVEIDLTAGDVHKSSKLQATISLVTASVAVKDRVVIVSNFTRTLDLVQDVLTNRGFKPSRLDGSTPSAKRQPLVDRFNGGRIGEDVFLLSSKAGGVGLNLIGANRIILFDPDWNPAVDLQAMARVWRDGQKKKVYIYRLISTGTIEEKMYQRQIFKGELQTALSLRATGISGVCMEQLETLTGSKTSISFNAKELKQLFKYSGSTVQYCDTLEVLSRSALCSGEEWGSAASLLESFQEYRTSRERLVDQSRASTLEHDSILRMCMSDGLSDIITYVYTKRSKNREASLRMSEDAGKENERAALTKFGFRPPFDDIELGRDCQYESKEVTEHQKVKSTKEAETCPLPKYRGRDERTAFPSRSASSDEGLATDDSSVKASLKAQIKSAQVVHVGNSSNIQLNTEPVNKISWAAAFNELESALDLDSPTTQKCLD